MNEKNDKDKILLYNGKAVAFEDVAKMCIKSIREYSDLPIFVYLMNSDLKINIKDVVTLRWDLDIEEEDNSSMYLNTTDNFYINRNNKKIYHIFVISI